MLRHAPRVALARLSFRSRILGPAKRGRLPAKQAGSPARHTALLTADSSLPIATHRPWGFSSHALTPGLVHVTRSELGLLFLRLTACQLKPGTGSKQLASSNQNPASGIQPPAHHQADSSFKIPVKKIAMAASRESICAVNYCISNGNEPKPRANSPRSY